MKKLFTRPKALLDKPFHFCPGCSHGKIYHLIAEVMDELDIVNKTVGVACVGCGELAFEYFNCDFIQVAHGRAPAAATGVKRSLKDRMVFTYQGDGDLAAIGTAEIVHAAARGENITTFFVNNSIFGMTGGQMAPTSLLSQKTTTTPYGRDAEYNGFPIRVPEMLATLSGATYLARGSVHDYKSIIDTKQYIKKAFLNQLDEGGFSLVEILSLCPTNWGCTPIEAIKRVENKMIPYYPLGEIKNEM